MRDTHHRERITSFLASLNERDQPPTWTEAAAMGMQLIDLSREEFAIRSALHDLEQADQGFAAIVDDTLASDVAADIADHQQRLALIEERPGVYFLASGEVIQHDPVNHESYKSGWWYDDRTITITTPNGERLHRPGIHPQSTIDPTAHVDPTARVERGVTIGPKAQIGAYAHLGRDAIIGANSVVQDGTWIGSQTELWANNWVSDGAMIDPQCTIGHHATIGAGARVSQGVQVEPYARLGAGTTTSTSPKQGTQRGVQVANAIESLMRLDRD